MPHAKAFNQQVSEERIIDELQNQTVKSSTDGFASQSGKAYAAIQITDQIENINENNNIEK